ncbi:hypothetical protein EDD21DRAFT_385372 [Dissophora ornata]|nr:hypothetical protein EDD21DRAFT_385372 [Dissophora ornata]
MFYLRPVDRWATGTLYDNIRSHGFNIRNRSWMGSGQGWPGAFHAAYRCSADARGVFQSPPGGTNWIINYQGPLQQFATFDGDDATFLNYRPENGKVIPRSLYWSQLVARMGSNDQSAAVLEKYVGVAGKNIYSPPLPMRFTQLDEIMASEQAILADLEPKRRKKKHANIRWETDITSTTDIQKEIERFEQELADKAEV